MKLIMENWKGFVNEQFDACDTPFTIGDMMIATDIASVIDDEAKRREKVAKLEKDPKWKKNLRKAMPIAKAMGKLGLSAFTTLAPIPDPITMAMDARALAAETGEVFGKIFVDANRKEEKYAEAPAARQFLTAFCVDPETLDMIDDKFQRQYFQESDIVDEVKKFFANNPPETRIPDLTDHLVDWMNNNSSYADSDFTSIQTER
jgi:hypothetical protein